MWPKWKACQTNFLSKDNHDYSTPHGSLQNMKLTYPKDLTPFHILITILTSKQNKKIYKIKRNKNRILPSYKEYFCLIHILIYQILSVQDQCLKCSLFNSFNTSTSLNLHVKSNHFAIIPKIWSQTKIWNQNVKNESAGVKQN